MNWDNVRWVLVCRISFARTLRNSGTPQSIFSNDLFHSQISFLIPSGARTW